MNKAILHWVLPLTGLLVLGPLAGMLMGMLRAEDGSRAVTVLLSSSPAIGVMALAGAAVLAAVIGVIAARLIGTQRALFCSGLVLAWAAWNTATIDAVVRRTQPSIPFVMLAVEGVLVLGAALGVAWCSTRREVLPPADPDREGEWLQSLVLPFILALVMGGVVAWFGARDTLKGQAIGAAALAGVAAALVTRLSSPRAPTILCFGALGVLAIASPILGMLIVPNGMDAVKAAYAGQLFPLGRIMPLDWLAGAFLGVPIGISWGASMVDKAHQPRPAAA